MVSVRSCPNAEQRQFQPAPRQDLLPAKAEPITDVGSAMWKDIEGMVMYDRKENMRETTLQMPMWKEEWEDVLQVPEQTPAETK